MMDTSDTVFVMYVFSRLNGACNWMAHESINAFPCILTKKPALKCDVSFTFWPWENTFYLQTALFSLKVYSVNPLRLFYSNSDSSKKT